MQLSLRSLQDAHEHFEKQFEPSLFPDGRRRAVPGRFTGHAVV